MKKSPQNHCKATFHSLQRGEGYRRQARKTWFIEVFIEKAVKTFIRSVNAKITDWLEEVFVKL